MKRKPPEQIAIVCALRTEPLYLADNLTGECAECNKPIQYRPHDVPNARRVCLGCARGLTRGQKVKVGVTKEVAQELAAYFGADKTKPQ
jgi:hypothetical protein